MLKRLQWWLNKRKARKIGVKFAKHLTEDQVKELAKVLGVSIIDES